MMRARTDEDDFDPSGLIQIGTVKSVDLAAARCIVETGDVETPPLRWIEGRMGATRIWSPPSAGEQVLLICMDGELGGGLVLRGIPSDAFAPAGNSAEELIAFADGARIAYDPEAHRLTALLPGGSTADITADQVNITNSHKHGGVQAGGAQTSPPL